jgi:hypothetical protein
MILLNLTLVANRQDVLPMCHIWHTLEIARFAVRWCFIRKSGQEIISACFRQYSKCQAPIPGYVQYNCCRENTVWDMISLTIHIYSLTTGDCTLRYVCILCGVLPFCNSIETLVRKRFFRRKGNIFTCYRPTCVPVKSALHLDTK